MSRRSSILKIKPDEICVEMEPRPRRSFRRISFADEIQIKEYRLESAVVPPNSAFQIDACSIESTHQILQPKVQTLKSRARKCAPLQDLKLVNFDKENLNPALCDGEVFNVEHDLPIKIPRLHSPVKSSTEDTTLNDLMESAICVQSPNSINILNKPKKVFDVFNSTRKDSVDFSSHCKTELFDKISPIKLDSSFKQLNSAASNLSKNPQILAEKTNYVKPNNENSKTIESISKLDENVGFSSKTIIMDENVELTCEFEPEVKETPDCKNSSNYSNSPENLSIFNAKSFIGLDKSNAANSCYNESQKLQPVSNSDNSMQKLNTSCKTILMCENVQLTCTNMPLNDLKTMDFQDTQVKEKSVVTNMDPVYNANSTENLSILNVKPLDTLSKSNLNLINEHSKKFESVSNLDDYIQKLNNSSKTVLMCENVELTCTDLPVNNLQTIDFKDEFDSQTDIEKKNGFKDIELTGSNLSVKNLRKVDFKDVFGTLNLSSAAHNNSEFKRSPLERTNITEPQTNVNCFTENPEHSFHDNVSASPSSQTIMISEDVDLTCADLTLNNIQIVQPPLKIEPQQVKQNAEVTTLEVSTLSKTSEAQQQKINTAETSVKFTDTSVSESHFEDHPKHITDFPKQLVGEKLSTFDHTNHNSTNSSIDINLQPTGDLSEVFQESISVPETYHSLSGNKPFSLKVADPVCEDIQPFGLQTEVSQSISRNETISKDVEMEIGPVSVSLNPQLQKTDTCTNLSLTPFSILDQQTKTSPIHNINMSTSNLNTKVNSSLLTFNKDLQNEIPKLPAGKILSNSVLNTISTEQTNPSFVESLSILKSPSLSEGIDEPSLTNLSLLSPHNSPMVYTLNPQSSSKVPSLSSSPAFTVQNSSNLPSQLTGMSPKDMSPQDPNSASYFFSKSYVPLSESQISMVSNSVKTSRLSFNLDIGDDVETKEPSIEKLNDLSLNKSSTEEPKINSKHSEPNCLKEFCEEAGILEQTFLDTTCDLSIDIKPSFSVDKSKTFCNSRSHASLVLPIDEDERKLRLNEILSKMKSMTSDVLSAYDKLRLLKEKKDDLFKRIHKENESMSKTIGFLRSLPKLSVDQCKLHHSLTKEIEKDKTEIEALKKENEEHNAILKSKSLNHDATINNLNSKISFLSGLSPWEIAEVTDELVIFHFLNGAVILAITLAKPIPGYENKERKKREIRKIEFKFNDSATNSLLTYQPKIVRTLLKNSFGNEFTVSPLNFPDSSHIGVLLRKVSSTVLHAHALAKEIFTITSTHLVTVESDRFIVHFSSVISKSMFNVNFPFCTDWLFSPVSYTYEHFDYENHIENIQKIVDQVQPGIKVYSSIVKNIKSFLRTRKNVKL